MTGSDWKHPHIVVLLGAAAIAFGGGYVIGQNRAQPRAAGPIILTNELTTAPRPRARPDENALVAENAEPEEAARPARPEAAEPAERPAPRPPTREPRPVPSDRDAVEPDAVDAEPRDGKPQDE